MHPVFPSPASGLNSQPPPSVQAGSEAALDTGPLWSCPWSAHSAASPPPPPAAAAAGEGAPAARGIPPAAPLTRRYPGSSPTRAPGPRGSAGESLSACPQYPRFLGPQLLLEESGLLNVPAWSTLRDLGIQGSSSHLALEALCSLCLAEGPGGSPHPLRTWESSFPALAPFRDPVQQPLCPSGKYTQPPGTPASACLGIWAP